MVAVLGDRVFAGDVTLEITTCASCGVSFALPVHMLNERRRTGKDFYCPNGHGLSYRQTTEEKMRVQLDAARARARHEADQREAAERSVRAHKGANTRLRKRVAAGVCPCCSRSFQNLARHMAGQHPDYATAET